MKKKEWKIFSIDRKDGRIESLNHNFFSFYMLHLKLCKTLIWSSFYNASIWNRLIFFRRLPKDESFFLRSHYYIV